MIFYTFSGIFITKIIVILYFVTNPLRMRNTKLVRYLKSLTDEEIIELGKYFTHTKTNPTLVSLYNYVIRFHPEYDIPDEQQTAKKIKDTKDNKLTVKQLQTNASKLAGLIEDFFIQKEMMSDATQQKKLLIQALAQRGLYAEFEQETAKLLQYTEGVPAPSPEIFLLSFELQQALFFHPNTDKAQLHISLDQALDNLDKAYLLYKLRLTTDIMSRGNFFKSAEDPYSIEYLNQFLNSLPEPVFQILALTLQLLSAPEQKELFQQLKSVFQDNLLSLSTIDKSIIANKLMNYANQTYERGHTEYLRQLFDIYQLAHEHDFLLHNRHISYITFINVAAVAAGVGEYAWGKAFIKNYAHYLEEEVKPNSIHIAQAFIQLFQGKYGEALKQLNQVNEFHIPTKLQADALYIRALYEMLSNDSTYFDPLASKLESFQKFILRSKLLQQTRKTAFHNFITAVRKMMNYYNDYKYKSLDRTKLITGIENLKPLYGNRWISAKLQELPE